MKNFIQPGESVELLAPYDVSSGGGVLSGALFGVASIDAKTGETLNIARRGVFSLAKTSAQAWTVGQKVYWDDANKVATTTASGNTLLGVAHAAAANPSSVGEVLLDGAAR